MSRTVRISVSLFIAAAACARETDRPADPVQVTAVGSRVDVNGMQMYYEVSGTGEPLVVLHGAYMNIPAMGAIIPKLAETHKVYALEFQGHGRTTDIDRPITYPALADDVAAFMDKVGLHKADVFGYSMGAQTGMMLAIRYPAKVNKLVAASMAYDLKGWQPAFTAAIPQMTVEMMVGLPFAADYRKLAPNPDGFPGLAAKLIALEKEPMAWGEQIKAVKIPVLIISGDADVSTLEHVVSMFRLLGGGVMGDMGTPLPASRLAVLPASSHTAVIGQTDLLHALIEPFLKGVTPKGFFVDSASAP
jgi:pimeloyl-ACP methyl ester carboxylesterase